MRRPLSSFGPTGRLLLASSMGLAWCAAVYCLFAYAIALRGGVDRPIVYLVSAAGCVAFIAILLVWDYGRGKLRSRARDEKPEGDF